MRRKPSVLVLARRLFVLALELGLVMCWSALPFLACLWSAYAGESLTSLALLATLARAQRVLRISRLVAALYLAACKIVLVPLSAWRSSGAVHSADTEEAPPLSEVLIPDRSKYVEVVLGLAANEDIWREAPQQDGERLCDVCVVQARAADRYRRYARLLFIVLR